MICSCVCVLNCTEARTYGRSGGGDERFVHFEVRDDPGNGACGGGDGDDEAGDAEQLQAHPPRAPPGHLLLHDVHLHGEVDGERPEPQRAQEPDHVVEEGQQHGHHRRGHHERRPPRQPEQAELVAPAAGGPERERDVDLARDVAGLGPPLARPLLDEGEQGLAVDLVGADEVHGDGGVGDVEEPEGLVEAEAREEVPGGVVPERGVPHAPAQHVEERGDGHADDGGAPHDLGLGRRRRADGVLDLDEDERVGVGEGDVAERLQAAPHLVDRGDQADADPRQAALHALVGHHLRDAQAQADGGVGERHDGGEDGEPRYLVEVRDLREENLHDAEDDHVGRAGDVAGVPVPLHVEAVRPLDRPACSTRTSR
jgi:hypothetical protein